MGEVRDARGVAADAPARLVEQGYRVGIIDLTDGDIDGGEMDVLTAQLAWWATRNMLVSLNYRRTWTDRFDIDGQMDVVAARVALFLQ